MNERLTPEQYADAMHDISERAYNKACELAESETDLIDGLYDILWDRYYEQWKQEIGVH